MQFNQDIQKAAKLSLPTWWSPDMEMDAKGLILIRVSKRSFFSHLVAVWLQSLHNFVKNTSHNINPSFWTRKNFLEETFAQLSQQIQRILITEMKFCEKTKFIVFCEKIKFKETLLPTLPNTQ